MRVGRAIWLGLLFVVSAVGTDAPSWAEDVPRGRRKLALLVGIDAYGAEVTPALPAGEQWARLSGSVNDVRALEAELKHREFDVTVLLDKQATRERIIQTFRDKLVSGVRPGRGDVAYFHFSGHGQQIPDDNGDEADGYDESLVPYDNRGKRDFSGHLRDDTVAVLLAELRKKTDNIVVSLDSCHSGTATRGSLAVRGAAPWHPPSLVKAGTGAADGPSGFLEAGAAVSDGYVLLSATQSNQLARETGAAGDPMGAFTYLLVQALRRASPDTTYQNLIDEIGTQMEGLAPGQNPQIEGDGGKKLFLGEWSAAPAYYLAKPMEKGGVAVQAGSLHGLTMGSIVGLYPLGSRVRDDATLIAKLELTQVGLGQSEGKLLAKWEALPVERLERGAEAVELEIKHRPARLRILLSALGEQLAKPLAELRYADVAATQGAKDPPWAIHIDWSPSAQARGARRLSMLGPTGEPLPIPAGKGKPVDTELDPADARLVPRIQDAIEAYYRRRRLAALDNPDPASRLDVRLRVWRIKAALDEQQRVQVDEASRKEVRAGESLETGELFQLELENRSGRDCYVTVLDLSSDGEVSILYPVSGQEDAKENLLGHGEKRVRRILMPYKVTPPAGKELLVALATQSFVNFRALAFRVRTGGAHRGARVSASPLEGLMEEVLDRTRSEAAFSLPQLESWGTARFAFDVRQPTPLTPTACVQ